MTGAAIPRVSMPWGQDCQAMGQTDTCLTRIEPAKCSMPALARHKNTNPGQSDTGTTHVEGLAGTLLEHLWSSGYDVSLTR